MVVVGSRDQIFLRRKIKRSGDLRAIDVDSLPQIGRKENALRAWILRFGGLAATSKCDWNTTEEQSGDFSGGKKKKIEPDRRNGPLLHKWRTSGAAPPRLRADRAPSRAAGPGSRSDNGEPITGRDSAQPSQEQPVNPAREREWRIQEPRGWRGQAGRRAPGLPLGPLAGRGQAGGGGFWRFSWGDLSPGSGAGEERERE